jgi:hypothetical protein
VLASPEELSAPVSAGAVLPLELSSVPLAESVALAVALVADAVALVAELLVVGLDDAPVSPASSSPLSVMTQPPKSRAAKVTRDADFDIGRFS